MLYYIVILENRANDSQVAKSEDVTGESNHVESESPWANPTDPTCFDMLPLSATKRH